MHTQANQIMAETTVHSAKQGWQWLKVGSSNLQFKSPRSISLMWLTARTYSFRYVKKLIYIHHMNWIGMIFQKWTALANAIVIVWSSYKWTGTGSGPSVSWTRSNRSESGTRYTPALDCYLLTFDIENVAYMHLLFNNNIFINASNFLRLMWSAWFIRNKC